MTEFFTNESTSLEKVLESNENPIKTSSHQLDDAYQLLLCENWIKTNGFTKVCLQFPDHLLPDSYQVVARLEKRLGFHVYVLGDTSYGSCCIDYVAAAHVNADSIIHYGPTCSSLKSETIPSLNISERKCINVENIHAKVTELALKPVILLDEPYAHLLNEITDLFDTCQVCTTEDREKWTNWEYSDVLFLTDCQKKLLDFKLTTRTKTLYYWLDIGNSIVPYEDDLKHLKRRHFLIEKIKDCQTLGIVVATLAVKNYRTVIERIKQLATLHKKKFYLISVGKPTVAKLANFPEIDVYVIIACALNETSDSRDYYKTMVTPYDVEMALNPLTPVNLTFTHDFNKFLANPIGDEVEQSNDVSLITGQVRVAMDSDPSTNLTGDVSDVISKCHNRHLMSVGNNGAGFLAGRNWQGLDPKLGEGDVTMATEGRTGIAQCYSDET